MKSLNILAKLHLVPTARRAARLFDPMEYNLGPFRDRPIPCLPRDDGWIRQYEGDLRIEPNTGLIYDGFKPIARSWDGLYEKDLHRPPTDPISMFRREYVMVDSAILLSTLFELNYYHFWFDLVSKVEMIDRSGIALDVPVIVTDSLAATDFFKDSQGLGLFGSRKVLVQSRQCGIRSKRIYVVKPDAYSRRQLSFPSRKLGSRPDPLCRDRIYVARGVDAALDRRILNEEALIEKLAAMGFSVVEPGELPLQDQISRFSRAGIVVGPHGSGLANILFRFGAPMALIELINDTKKYHHHFYNIAIRCGFFYRATLNRAEPGREDRARAHADIDSTLSAVAEAMAWEKTN